MEKKVIVMGAGIIDVLAFPVGPEVFVTGSEPMEDIRLSFGGDALNEAVGLSKLGRSPYLVTKLGRDEAGEQVYSFVERQGVRTQGILWEEGLSTGVNLVLVDKKGERNFLTNPSSSLRRLSKEDVFLGLSQLPPIEEGDVVSFASVFVSTSLSLGDLEEIFSYVKGKGAYLTADFTRAKRGEKLSDLRMIFSYLDTVFINEKEAAALTGEEEAKRNMALFLEAGAHQVVMKIGKKGCLLGREGSEEILEIPALSGRRCIDTTGAGDSFAAGFLFAKMEGKDPIECALFGGSVASMVVEKLGATEGITSLEEAKERYRHLKAEWEK
ncbi:MAG: carbohydrate kinase family protein [Blautia sp.]|nr:carbohydrate kinase family protein [Blautia sp.]